MLCLQSFPAESLQSSPQLEDGSSRRKSRGYSRRLRRILALGVARAVQPQFANTREGWMRAVENGPQQTIERARQLTDFSVRQRFDVIANVRIGVAWHRRHLELRQRPRSAGHSVDRSSQHMSHALALNYSPTSAERSPLTTARHSGRSSMSFVCC